VAKEAAWFTGLIRIPVERKIGCFCLWIQMVCWRMYRQNKIGRSEPDYTNDGLHL